jgi:hypothetical protein
MRSEFLSKHGPIWHYHRPSHIFPLHLRYDTRSNAIIYNRNHRLIPFGIGGIFPPGEFIADLITYHLFLKGIITIRGIAYTYKEKTICITAPGCNGKTHFLDSMLKKGATYIAEDLLVIDTVNGTVYPTCPFIHRHPWQPLRTLTMKKQDMDIAQHPRKIDMLYCTENTQKTSYTPRTKVFPEFFFVSDRFFLKNRFIRSLIFEEGTWDQVLNTMSQIPSIPHRFVPIQKFRYDTLGVE